MKRADIDEFDTFDRSSRDLEREPRSWRTMGEVVARRNRARVALDAMRVVQEVTDEWSRFTGAWSAIGHCMQVTDERKR